MDVFTRRSFILQCKQYYDDLQCVCLKGQGGRKNKTRDKASNCADPCGSTHQGQASPPVREKDFSFSLGARSAQRARTQGWLGGTGCTAVRIAHVASQDYSLWHTALLKLCGVTGHLPRTTRTGATGLCLLFIARARPQPNWFCPCWLSSSPSRKQTETMLPLVASSMVSNRVAIFSTSCSPTSSSLQTATTAATCRCLDRIVWVRCLAIRDRNSESRCSWSDSHHFGFHASYFATWAGITNRDPTYQCHEMYQLFTYEQVACTIATSRWERGRIFGGFNWFNP